MINHCMLLLVWSLNSCICPKVSRAMNPLHKSQLERLEENNEHQEFYDIDKKDVLLDMLLHIFTVYFVGYCACLVYQIVSHTSFNYSLQSMLVIDKAQDLDDMSLFLFVKLTMEPGPLMLLLAYNDISLESRPSFMRVRNSTAIGMSISLFNLFRLLRLCTSSQEVTPCWWACLPYL